MDILQNFYNLKEVGEETRQIESRFFKQRFFLLKTIWFSHRRQLLATLPMIEDLFELKNRSVYELFGSLDRVDNLYQVVINTLAELANFNLLAMERTLINLALSLIHI